MPSVAYCVVTFCGYPSCRETIDSLPADARLLVIDNSITDWALSKAWNYAIDRLCIQEGYDAVVIANDDVVLRSDTGDLLASALLERQFVDERPCPDAKIEMVTAYNTRDLPDVGPRWGTGPDFSCFCVTKEIFDTMGRFDEEFPLYFEDNDAHHRLRMAGYEALSFAPYLHYGSQSSRRENGKYESIAQEKYRRSEIRYKLKWGSGPGDERYRVPFNGRQAVAV